MKVETKLASLHLPAGNGCRTEHHPVVGSLESRDFNVLVFVDRDGCEVHVYANLESLEAIRDSVEAGIHKARHPRADVPAGGG